jgi:hypothetical protein
MHGKRTAIILGAGASHCYEDGHGPLPLQKDIVGRLGGISVSSGTGAPDLGGPAGLTHSRALAEVLYEKYGLFEDDAPGSNRLAFWDQLRSRGETLETVYADLESSLPFEKQFLLADFAAILRTSVKLPIPSREPTAVCRHHRRLVEALEPGDYIIDFNWDSLMGDSLLYHCPFWYPRTGFGFGHFAAITSIMTKALLLPSLVHLFHIHGSVLLYELLKSDPGSVGTGEILYLGPPGYSEINSLSSLLGTSPKDPIPKKSASDLELWAIGVGFLYCGGRWFKPLFVPPSSEKGEYRHWWHRELRMAIHSVLPTTESFIVVGYSFPEADVKHLSGIFVQDIIQESASLTIINPSCPDPEFQDRVRSIFSGLENLDFNHSDFKEFSAGLENKIPRIFFH